MRLSRLASSVLALALLGGAATARPYTYLDRPVEDTAELVAPRDFARPAPVKLDRAKVKAALARMRAHNLAAFRNYRLGGVYPHNFVNGRALNVWLDQEGRLCAAATIIAADNYDLAMKVTGMNNFIRLADVKDGELMDWILTSGFTQDEIVAIQEPFMGEMPVDIQDPMRLAEDERLGRRYAQVDRQLVKNRKQSLDLAVDRLMSNPALAATLLAS